MKRNRKYIMFNKTITDEECGVEFVENVKYCVTDENSKVYYIGIHSGKKYAISKELENTLYFTGEIIMCN